MYVQYDPDANAVYVKLRPHEGHTRGRRLDDRRVVHYDDEGHVVAIELLFVSRGMNLEGLPEAGRVRDLLRSFPRLTSA